MVQALQFQWHSQTLFLNRTQGQRKTESDGLLCSQCTHKIVFYSFPSVKQSGKGKLIIYVIILLQEKLKFGNLILFS